MKNIVVPIDFSENSRRAFLYAQELALYLDGSIKVIHVTHPTISTTYPYPMDSFDDEIDAKEAELKEFMTKNVDREISGVLTKTNIKHEVIHGFAAEVIVDLSNSEEVDLIVMGTTGRGGVLDKLLGSVSTIVAQQSHCPVLLVPQEVDFKDYVNILYASDYKSSTNKLLEEIADVAGRFSAKVHLVHVQEQETKPAFKMEEMVLDQIFQEKAPNAETKFVTVWDADIWHGLNVYARDFAVDLIVLVKPHRKFWDKLWHKSITKKIINKASLPILILHIEE